ncbi:polyprenyl synthetase family protein [bacterium]|nr:MAG: polyprenyl synthetase family protein [bacterium]
MKEVFEHFEEELIGARIPKEPASLYDPVRYTMALGGKRIRPRLVALATGITGGDVSLSKDAAIAVEMLHNFTLIHDDIMDNAATRRGKPSVFKKWDANTAILSGDVLFTLAMEQLEFYQTKHFKPYVYPLLMNEFLKATRVVCDGQQRDMDFEKEASVSLDDYLLMISQKTARLLSASLKMGGIIAEAAPEQIQSLYEIGYYAGIAFQIQDDLLDAFGDPTTFGKKQGGDIREGKKTYLSILALEEAKESDKKELSRILASKNASDDEINWVLNCYRTYGIDSKTAETVSTFYQSALDELHQFPESTYKQELIRFLDQLNTRIL